MNNIAQIIVTSIIQALQELRVNKLRTFLSLLGITIGIFSIIAVGTALDSAQNMIQKNVETLGSDVLYVGRWPWPGIEEGEYRWWDYWRRPSMTNTEVNAINGQLHTLALTTLCLPVGGITVKYESQELSNIRGYSINIDFDKVQNIDIAKGRFLSAAELGGGNSCAVLGSEVAAGLFTTGINPLGKSITVMGRKLVVVGVMKKLGQNMADFDFDNGILFPYNFVSSLVDVKSLEYNPRLIVKSYNVANVAEVKDEVRGIIRRVHRLKPDVADDFVINQLSGLSKLLNKMFGTINVVGWFIGLFSLAVGAFGSANIMFVSVKERTKIIGLKKAIGAKRAYILMEFLMESIVLCVIGGSIGILIVLLLSLVVSHVMDIQVVLSMKNFLIGITVSVVVGILSGIIPAWKASKLDAVVAIRSN